MIFYALTSAGPRVWCCNPSLKGGSFNSPKGPTCSRCLGIRKNMFDHYYLIKSICCLKIWKNVSKSSIFLLPIPCNAECKSKKDA